MVSTQGYQLFVWRHHLGEAVRIVFRKTVVGEQMFHLQSQVTLKMTTTQVVETSVTNNGLSKDYPHPEDHAKQRQTKCLCSKG